MSSSSSLASSSSPAPTRKKRRFEVDSSDRDTSDASSANEEQEDAEPLPATEVTVLSHAERRRQKKKEKQQLAVASESPRKKRKLDADGTSASDPKAKAKRTKVNPATDDSRRQKRQNSVWVGNLSFRTTQDALRGFFDGVGMITRIHMPMRRGQQVQGENMGFAYVDFETPDAKVIAITLSEGQLDGRNLLIKDGDDFTGRPAKAKAEGVEGGENEKPVRAGEGTRLSKKAQNILRAQKQPPAPTLFLGNLGFETTEDSIRELFETHRYWGHKDKGKGVEGQGQDGDTATLKDVWIRKVRMGTFEDSGACKGFAFVDFTSIDHATEALVNPRNHRLNGRDLVVEYASPDAVRRGGGARNPKGDGDQVSKKVPQKRSANAPHPKQRRSWHTEQEDAIKDEEIPVEVAETRLQQSGRVSRDRPHTRRAKPGAALAHAQRQSAAILPSEGQKIVF